MTSDRGNQEIVKNLICIKEIRGKSGNTMKVLKDQGFF